MRPELIAKREETRHRINELRRRGNTVGLVPTMGALHAGHLSLVEASAKRCDFTVVTIFVNPVQFGPDEDFTKYPRDLQRDLELLEPYRVGMVFAPPKEEIYRPGHSTYVDPALVARPLEGEYRPHHFRGVATIVLKLFQTVPADVAFFGRKDYQQTLVVRRMVEDLDLPITIQVCPIIREPDGLALSSRNAYLSAAGRRQALAISRCLRQAALLFRDGETNAQVVQESMCDVLRDADITRVDYAVLVHPETLENVTQLDADSVALVAAHVEQTRLIDNIRLGLSDIGPNLDR